jgi:N6-adenosine-specific RNA methylase IME4
MKYGVIAGDPPWPFGTHSIKGKGRGAEAYYDVMSLEQIMALPVGDLATKDAALFLWCYTPLLDRMPEVMKAWGFTFKSTGFVWVKCNADRVRVTRLGMGFGTRKQAELCLLGTRGAPKCLSKGVPEVIMAPRRAPHQKPDEAYERIEKLFAGPYCELFARQRWPGWDQKYSNEADTGPAGRRFRSDEYPNENEFDLHW